MRSSAAAALAGRNDVYNSAADFGHLPPRGATDVMSLSLKFAALMRACIKICMLLARSIARSRPVRAARRRLMALHHRGASYHLSRVLRHARVGEADVIDAARR